MDLSHKKSIFWLIVAALTGFALAFYFWSCQVNAEPINFPSFIFVGLSGVICSLLASYLALSILSPDHQCARKEFNEILATGINQYLADQESMRSKDWATFISDTHRDSEIYIIGTANSEWLRNDRCKKAIIDVVTKKNITIYVYFLDPESSWAEAREENDKDNKFGKTKERIKNSIEKFKELASENNSKGKGNIILRQYDAMPSTGIITNGSRIFIKHYLTSTSNNRTPIAAFNVPTMRKRWRLSIDSIEGCDEYVEKYFLDLYDLVTKFRDNLPVS
ncbi:MAG: hypothetical protein ACL93V_09740 [Candidatus Electrothrix sp. YB6]